MLKNELAKFKDDGSASEALAAYEADSHKSSHAVRGEVASIKAKRTSSELEKTQSDKVIAGTRGKSEQRIMRLKVAHFGRNRV